MRKMWIVIKREYAQVVKKKSFLIGIILTPLFLIAITALPAFLATKKSSSTEHIAIIDLDQQGIGEKFKESLVRYKLDDNETPAYQVTDIHELDPADTTKITELRKTLDSLILDGQLKSYLVIYGGVEQNDSAFQVAKSFSFRTSSRFERRLSNIVSGIRLKKMNIGVSTDSVLNVTRGINLKQQAPGGKERDFMTMYLSGIVFVMIIFMTAIGYGQILMRSVIEEKNSRIIEVLVSSISPFQLMAGKVVGLGLASLTQVAIWFLIGGVIYAFRASLDISADISGVIFNPIFIIYFLLFLVLGYLMYSTLFALIGSIVNSDKEAQNFIFPIIISLMLPLVLAMYIVQEPDSTLAVVLSLIPFFTPTMMILRINFIGVEVFNFSNPIIFEATLGVILTALTTLAVIWITGRIFRIGILMYGKRPTLPELLKWTRY
ncbi:MAG: ABC transporter permease [Candidatus Zixiibacteriota bacterium]|nr:MAG: ABC transporter permease [candidate division Zixibacteria bacterium]